MSGYPMMELESRTPIEHGELQLWRVYWKYPDGRKVPFTTPEWNGIQPVEVKTVRAKKKMKKMNGDWNYLRKFREALKGPLDFLYRNFKLKKRGEF